MFVAQKIKKLWSIQVEELKKIPLNSHSNKRIVGTERKLGNKYDAAFSVIFTRYSPDIDLSFSQRILL